MGDRKTKTVGKRLRREIEVVDTGNRQAEAVAILQHYLGCAKRGELSGIVLLIEQHQGGYRCAMTGTANVAERLGRLDLLKEQVLDMAEILEED